MTPIERAARALCSLEGNPENIKFEGKPMWQSYLPQVRAVLTSVREPSEGMKSAGWAAELSNLRTADQLLAPDDAVDVWQSMLDAALDGS